MTQQIELATKCVEEFMNCFRHARDEEVDKIYNNKHSPIEISIGYLKVLHQDVSQAVLQHWENVEVPREVNNLQKCTKK